MDPIVDTDAPLAPYGTEHYKMRGEMESLPSLLRASAACVTTIATAPAVAEDQR